jgi:hypothetical protein
MSDHLSGRVTLVLGCLPVVTSETPAACFLAFPFLPSSRSVSVFDHQPTTRTTTTTRTIGDAQNRNTGHKKGCSDAYGRLVSV